MKALFSDDAMIPTRKGEEAPPEGTPAHYMTSSVGFHTGVWLTMWHEITEKEGALQFPKYGTFNLRILDNLRRMLYVLRPPVRATQLEALDAWVRVAHAQHKGKDRAEVKRRVRS